MNSHPGHEEASRNFRLYQGEIVLLTFYIFWLSFYLYRYPDIGNFPLSVTVLCTGIGAVLLGRWTALKWPSIWSFYISEMWIITAAIISFYSVLGPLIDLFSPQLKDAALIALDQRYFGGHPAIWLEPYIHPWVVELLHLAYASYYFWPMILGTYLYFNGRQDDARFFVLVVVISFFTTYMGYVMVPAIGPRFAFDPSTPEYSQIGDVGQPHFARELKGVYFSQLIEGGLRQVPFKKDCFPSGHTAHTITWLIMAWLLWRRFFWVYLPAGMLLIAATLYCRYHYLIDLAAAIPTVMFVLGASWLLNRVLPRTIEFPVRQSSSEAWR